MIGGSQSSPFGCGDSLKRHTGWYPLARRPTGGQIVRLRRTKSRFERRLPAGSDRPSPTLGALAAAEQGLGELCEPLRQAARPLAAKAQTGPTQGQLPRPAQRRRSRPSAVGPLSLLGLVLFFEPLPKRFGDIIGRAAPGFDCSLRSPNPLDAAAVTTAPDISCWPAGSQRCLAGSASKY